MFLKNGEDGWSASLGYVHYELSHQNFALEGKITSW